MRAWATRGRTGGLREDWWQFTRSVRVPDRKFGRISPEVLPKDDPGILHFGAYTKPHLRPPPVRADWSKNQNYPICLNDQIGDCAIAAAVHQIQSWSANTGSAVLVNDATTLQVYEAVSGYDPRNAATDQGCVLKDVYAYWKDVGIGGNNISAAVSVDPSQQDRIKWAVTIFGGVCLGINLPQSAIDQSDIGKPWTVVPRSKIAGGHAVECYGYDRDGLLGTSWGEYVRITWPFVAEYTEEAWCFIDPYWFDATGINPVGLNFASLMTDARLL